MSRVTDIDWDELRAAATEAMQRAYAPYSRYRVGAAALARIKRQSGMRRLQSGRLG